ncbi:DUF6440 family protein [Caproiciproducens galactitolivorans]|nr:DUF6440 family protein [Caproiciproducens galactitolivorans]
MYSQGTEIARMLVDTETGVHYLQTLYGSGGKPGIRPVSKNE